MASAMAGALAGPACSGAPPEFMAFVLIGLLMVAVFIGYQIAGIFQEQSEYDILQRRRLEIDAQIDALLYRLRAKAAEERSP